MKKLEHLTVISNQPIALDTYEILLEGDLVQQINRPGQFVHIQISEGDYHKLRRPLSIASYNHNKSQMTLIYKVVGDGLNWMSQLSEGDSLNVLGPLGNGFETENLFGEKILVIGGGVGVPPLYALCQHLSEHNDVTAVLGYQSRAQIFYENQFKDVSDTLIATNDGSYGQKGFVTDIITDLNDDFTTYFACGPLEMLSAVQQQLQYLDGYLSIEERMGCGIGACFACVREAHNDKGYVKICQDGPVFHSSEVTL
ncbi:dihydroorotate dehydrogenase electron transfer subunit [Tenuibacillus multivorans]|uniref:Dihydroorotate dehydrogenase B (NAD(+)), electron transfer subunit n=1 Tax=Tenuibacillus multivorans TaxID=237069 RepID=A0A1G9Y4A9_9BACI|nr:dihydroorotate dehydrogenase electron transfer subunit [Tenuibacillus multivorans]GEL75942.1 dihydroorotate dehydrogenase B (NAD(+)), electron transfer subunit [Tenuibacillus multivorans]SDN03850.1 dihydroorotate dehydrogenase electron transfer subunit [Tenuibacillus multivorans]